jgi:hypothetical protein
MSDLSKPGNRKPVGDSGVKILSKGGDTQGVKRYSKEEGGSHEAQIESRVVNQEAFTETKKLTEDPDMEK